MHKKNEETVEKREGNGTERNGTEAEAEGGGRKGREGIEEKKKAKLYLVPPLQKNKKRRMSCHCRIAPGQKAGQDQSMQHTMCKKHIRPYAQVATQLLGNHIIRT